MKHSVLTLCAICCIVLCFVTTALIVFFGINIFSYIFP